MGKQPSQPESSTTVGLSDSLIEFQLSPTSYNHFTNTISRVGSTSSTPKSHDESNSNGNTQSKSKSTNNNSVYMSGSSSVISNVSSYSNQNQAKSVSLTYSPTARKEAATFSSIQHQFPQGFVSPYPNGESDIAAGKAQNQHQPIVQDQTAMIDTYSFFFEEQEYSDNNTLEDIQNNSFYYQRLAETFPEEKKVDLSDRAYAIRVVGERLIRINQILFGFSIKDYLSADELSSHIKYAWHSLETVSTVLHRPSFDINTCATELVAVLVYIGMVVPSHNKSQFRSVFQNLSQSCLETFSQRKKHYQFYDNLEYYQAITFLIWYNYRIVIFEDDQMTQTYINQVREDLYKYRLRGAVFHSSSEYELNLGNAKMNSEAYSFFLPPPSPTTHDSNISVEKYQEEQWLTWIKHESFIRTAYFCHVGETMQRYITQHEVNNSIMESDDVMICPLALWRATSPEMFFHCVGPRRKIITISNLLLMKCLLRLPSIMDNGTKQQGMKEIDGRNPWSLGHLYIVIYGLAKIGWVVEGCRYYQEMHQSQKLLKKRKFGSDIEAEEYCSDNSSTSVSLPMVNDKRAQTRVFNALEMWQAFSFKCCIQFMTPELTNTFHDPANAVKKADKVREQAGTYGLSSMWNESEAFVPWDGICGLSLHFQTCYFSIYTEGGYEGRILSSVSKNLENLLLYKDDLKLGLPGGYPHILIEKFLLFGTFFPSQEQLNELTTWANKDLTCNKLTISGFYIMNLIKSSLPITFGAGENIYARSLTLPAVLTVWAHQLSKKLDTVESPPEVLANFQYFKTCLHSPASIDPVQLYDMHFNVFTNAWYYSRGKIVNPNEDSDLKLIARLGGGEVGRGWINGKEHMYYDCDIEFDPESQCLNRRNKSHKNSTPTSQSPSSTTSDSTCSSDKSKHFDNEFSNCNIFTYLALMSYLDEMKLRVSPLSKDNDVLLRARKVFV